MDSMVGEVWQRINDPESNYTFIIAEAGVNHNGDVRLAKRLIDAAVGAGADAVKFQTFKAERLVTSDAPKADYQKNTAAPGRSQFEMLRQLELTEQAHLELYGHCQQKGIIFLSTPFDAESADLLERLGIGIFKVPSGEITNFELLTHIARKKKPMIVSTGMATLDEVRAAVQHIEKFNAQNYALLHCVSSYPTDPADVNLKAIRVMQEAFGVPVGFSDHTLGIETAVNAVFVGARIIEKHITLGRDMQGPDHKFSLEPGDLASLVREIRKAEVSLGNGVKTLKASEINTASVARRSLVAACDIKAGSVLSEDLLSVKRPGNGLSPATKSSVIGRKAKMDIPKDKAISWEMLL
jgi:N-acetylneuraminate synthase